MSSDAEHHARHRAMLTELATMEMSLARQLQARALSATDGETAAKLALAFERSARSIGKTLALRARLDAAWRADEAATAQSRPRRAPAPAAKTRRPALRLVETTPKGS